MQVVEYVGIATLVLLLIYGVSVVMGNIAVTVEDALMAVASLMALDVAFDSRDKIPSLGASIVSFVFALILVV